MGDLKISSKAEKNLGGWALFGSKYKDAADLFDKDGNCFKLAKSFLVSQFTLCLQLDSKHEAANAARYYKKSNIKDFIMSFLTPFSSSNTSSSGTIGTKPLSREGLDISVLICLRVSRFLDFNDSLLGIVETNLRSGPIYFDRFPNFTVSLKDIDILDSFTLNVKTFNYKTKIGSLPVTIIYGIHYKAMSLTFNIGAMRSSYKGETVLFKIDLQRSHLLVPKTISWSQVSLSQNRLLQDTILVEKLENTSLPDPTNFNGCVCLSLMVLI
ncbi:hypothetical protein H5410_031583 [Solanum commersonii]|uniref:Uncharacterized protein n=1 Tax=Solanum commersonii TaxID=4109 RepID=A0A9J5YJK9_SOLCO|nr:hypothetical protein H5410_031583 [Solanum commersonii]